MTRNQDDKLKPNTHSDNITIPTTNRTATLAKSWLLVPAVSFLFAAIAVFIFLTLVNPDSATKGDIFQFAWLVLFPAAFILSVWPLSVSIDSGLGMIAGIFIGVCVRAILPPNASNIWPIAAVFWTGLLFMPIAVGTVLGAIARLLWKRLH